MRFIFFILFLFFHSYAEFVYHNIIQLTVSASPEQIKNDLEIINAYKKNNIDMVPLYKDAGQSNFYVEADNKVDNSIGYFDLYRAVAKQLLEVNHNGIKDVCFYYRGFYKYSDESGRVIFPRLDIQDAFPLIITSEVVPVFFTGSMPDHFIIGDNVPYACYQARASYFEDNKENQKMTWSIHSTESVLEQKKVPYNAIIIFGNPTSFLFSDNAIIMQRSLNVLLPSLFIDSSISSPSDIFSHYGQLAINTLRYWESLEFNQGQTEFGDQIHAVDILV